MKGKFNLESLDALVKEGRESGGMRTLEEKGGKQMKFISIREIDSDPAPQEGLEIGMPKDENAFLVRRGDILTKYIPEFRIKQAEDACGILSKEVVRLEGEIDELLDKKGGSIERCH